MTTGRINQVAFLDDVAAARDRRYAPVSRSLLGARDWRRERPLASSRRQFESYKTRRDGQIGARRPLPSRWTESESSDSRPRAKAAATIRDDRGTWRCLLRSSRAKSTRVAKTSARRNANTLSRQCRARYATQETVVRPRPCALVSSCMKRRAWQDVAARAGIQPDRTRR
jgi:hypothetical protein